MTLPLWTVLAGLCEGWGRALGREGDAGVFPVKSLPSDVLRGRQG